MNTSAIQKIIIGCIAMLFAIAMTTSCSKNESVSSLDRNKLMALVFKGWLPGNTIVKSPVLKIDVTQVNTPSMDLKPLHVVRLSDNRAVLLIRAEPVESSHSSQAALGAYWFKREGMNWFLDQRQDEAAWLGASGYFGKTKVLELNPGNYGLLVEHSWAGMGQNNTWADLFKLGVNRVTPLIGDKDSLLLFKVTGLGTDCDELLKQTPGKTKSIRLNDSSDPAPTNCFSLNAKWQLTKGRVAPGDISLNSVAKMIVYSVVKTESEGENDFTIYERKSSVMRSTEVYRYDPAKDKYIIIKGHNLVPEWAGS